MNNYVDNLKRNIVLNSGLNYEETLADYNTLKAYSKNLEVYGIKIMSDEFKNVIENYIDKKKRMLSMDIIIQNLKLINQLYLENN